jgi:2'-hydroxyisoflavone reductase
MRILILGGGWFLGRALVEDALSKGHEVTTFNRGRSGTTIRGIEALHGDREDPASLWRLARGRTWDAAIDTSGYVPKVVLESSRALAGHVDRLAFVSTVSVYEGWPVEPLSEESAVLEAPSDAGTEFGWDGPGGHPTRYGFQKAGCERAVLEVFGTQALVLRPGVILGPYEYIGRLPWWLTRIARGSHVLAPGSPAREIQPIDVRDLATFVLNGLEAGLTSTFNVAAPIGQATFGSLLADCIQTTGSDAELVWVADEFLLDHGVRQWTELPLWRTYPGTWKVAADRAAAAGLSCRPLSETVRDTWTWLRSEGDAVAHERKSEHGIAPDKEAWLLAAWDASRRGLDYGGLRPGG